MRKVDRIAKKEREASYVPPARIWPMPIEVDRRIEEKTSDSDAESDIWEEDFDTLLDEATFAQGEREIWRDRREWREELVKGLRRRADGEYFYSDDDGEEVFDTETGHFVRIDEGMHLEDPKDD